MKENLKLIIISLAVLLLLSIALTACSESGSSGDGITDKPKTDTPKETPKTTAKDTNSNVNPPGQFPIVNDKITLKVFVRGNSLVEDFNTNEFTQFMEEKTNIHIEWSVADEKNYLEQLNLALASGDLPDVIMNMGVSPEQQMVYGEQGVFVSFTDLIEKYGENTKKIFQEMPEIKDGITAPGDNIYSLPYVNECIHCSLDYKMYVYQPWLEKLGLKEPTTLEEFRQMLKAFKEQDPNGNGKADEIAMIGSTDNRSQVDVFIMNSFIYDDGMKRFLIKDGKVDVAYNKPEWKEGLKYLNGLYKEGLLDGQSFTVDKAGLKKIAENPEIAIGGALPAHSPSTITIIEGESGRWLDYQPIAPLKGPSGEQVSTWLAYDKLRPGQFVMTSANKYPEATMRWADYMYEFENALRMNFGTEGKSWSKPQAGDMGRGGAKANYRLLVPFGRVQNESWAQYGLQYRTDKDYYAGQTVLTQPDKEKMYYDVTMEKYDPYKPDVSKVIPPLFFPTSDAQNLAEIDKTINDYMMTMIARFTIGDADIDKEWDSYVNTLDQMGLKTYIEIYQKALDAKK